MTDTSTRSSKGATFLFLLGLLLVGAGAALAYAPKYSWQVAKIAEQASAYGVQNGALVVGGLVVLGLAIVARSANGSGPSSDTKEELEGMQAEIHLLSEQLSTKVGQLRTALLQVQESIASVAAQQIVQLQSQPEPQADHSQDAVFRLAASLDKLHAHFDERVHAIDLQLRNGFETVLNAGLRGSMQAIPAPLPAPVPMPVPQYGHAYDPAPPSEGIDFYQTMQKLDAIAGTDVLDSQGHLGQPPHPQAPFPSPAGVEALDALLPEEYRDRY